MNSSSLPLEPPRRLSLVVQAADALTRAVKAGTWQEFLPSERRLCEVLRVSRPTVRSALRILAENGLIEISHGRRNRLLGAPQPSGRRRSRLVGLITHEPVAHMAAASFQIISEMRTHLTEQGFTTEVLVCQARSQEANRRKLEDFVRRNRVLCCVLLSVNHDLQRWFAQHAVPALVLGSCHPDLALPSLDIDYRSVCRHAGGVFLARGHRRMALVVPNSEVAGDLASEAGFLEAVPERQRSDIRASIVRHNGTAQNIAAKLDALFASAHPPTALLVAKPQHVFIVILYLLKRGLSVPDTVSFIARDHDHIFEIVNPPIAHYALREDAFPHRLSRLLLQMVNHGHLQAEPNLIFPRFLAGGTVKAPA